MKNYIFIIKDYYANLYFEALNVGESCFNCPYTPIHRESDFTLGYFWGVTEAASNFYDKSGVSLLLVHTEKAHEIFKKISNRVNYIQVCHTQVLQPRLRFPETKSDRYDEFWKDVNDLPYEEIIKKYGVNTITIFLEAINSD